MIILVYGQDTFRSWRYLQELKNKFLQTIDKSGLNLETVDGAKITLTLFSKVVNTVPFLSSKRLVIIKNLLAEKKNKELFIDLNKYLQSNKEKLLDQNSNILIFYEDTAKLGNYSLVSFLKNLPHVYNFDLLEGFALNKWIKQEVKNKGGQIDDDSVKELASLVGNDLWVLSQEINKLVAYKNKTKILKQDVCSLIKGKFDDNIFHFVDVLAQKDKAAAIRLLHHQLNSGAGYLYLLSMLIRQFRLLFTVKDMMTAQKTKKEISTTLSIHPFVAQKVILQAHNFSFPQLKNFYKMLLDLDFKLKNGFNKDRAQILFELFIAKVN